MTFAGPCVTHSSRNRTLGLLGGVAIAVACGALPAAADTILVSRSSAGVVGDNRSQTGAISRSGRYVAFWSEAANLVDGDTNAAWDVFVRDTVGGKTSRVSKSSGGKQGLGGDSEAPSISGNGRYVAFASDATNLVKGDTNAVYDVFVHDRTLKTTKRVSRSSGGKQGNLDSYGQALSADGRFVVFASDATNLVSGDTNGKRDIFVHDRETGKTSRVSKPTGGGQADGDSRSPSLSSDGRYVVFTSDAMNLASGDNSFSDVFVHDRKTKTTKKITHGDGNSYGAYSRKLISAGGRYVVFTSEATNLVADDTNGVADTFIHDRNTGVTIRASRSSAGVEGNGASTVNAISDDGRLVVFESAATNLVADDPNGALLDVFVFDRETGETRRVSTDSAGTGGSGVRGDISGDGRYVIFMTNSPLTGEDTNDALDVFAAGPLP